MKKIIALSLVVILAMAVLVGCGQNKNVAANGNTSNEDVKTSDDVKKYEDGIYFAQDENFDEKTGWKYMVTIEVKDGKIVSADWNGANKNAGVDKKTLSANGGYPMVANGGAQAEWHEQAVPVEAYLIETQDPTAIEYKDDEGHTDAISGVSIHVIEFFALAEKALLNDPVGIGQYKDGAYHGEAAEFDNGWKGTVDLTVINGFIVAANWNAINEEGGDDKKTTSINGGYPMVENGGAKTAWHEQAVATETYLLETQDANAIEYKDDKGHTDAITGVSIHVNDFYALVEEALKDAK